MTAAEADAAAAADEDAALAASAASAASKALKKAACKARRKASKEAKRAAQGLSPGRSVRFGARNENRAAVLVKWLVETFGVERLRLEGVCDVAGGRGEVAARLAHCHDVRCVLVEPREAVDLQETVLRKVAPRLPAKYRAHLLAAGRSDRVAANATHVRSRFPPRDDDAAAWRAVLGCGVWVGLHADGATEAIVEEALRRGKSFAVVPCCVFPTHFVSRMVAGLKPVRTTEELVDYLVAKAGPRAFRKTLAFEGRNVAVARDAGVVRSADDHAAAAADAVLRNEPVVLVGAAARWRAARDWVDGGGRLDVAAVTRAVGAAVAPVVRGDGARATTTVAAYLRDFWHRGGDDDGAADGPYLKDWHLARVSPEGEAPWYEAPPGLDDDWLGAYVARTRGGDDFDFCYVGARGTRTPLHADVLASYSWSGNVCGRKAWWLFPPSETPKLLDAGGALADDARALDDARFPDLAAARRLVCVQGPGDVLFVPSDWHHMVVNLEATLSINRNWFNGAAIDRVWAHVAREADAAAEALADCRGDVRRRYGGDGAWEREWAWMVERVLRDSARLNVTDFVALVNASVAATPAAVATKVRAALLDVEARYADRLFLDDAPNWPAAEEAASWSDAAARRGRATLAAALRAVEDGGAR